MSNNSQAITKRTTSFITATNTNGVTGLALVYDAIVHAFDNRGETSNLSRLCFNLNPSDGSRMKKILSAVVTGAKVNKNKETGEKLISFVNASVNPEPMAALVVLIEQGEGFRNQSVTDELFPAKTTEFDKVKYIKGVVKTMLKEGMSPSEIQVAYNMARLEASPTAQAA